MPSPLIRRLAGAWHASADWSERARIIALARSEPPRRPAPDPAGELAADDERGPAQWTLDPLARAARDASIAVSRSQVRRILLIEKVRWRRTRSWAASTAQLHARARPWIWGQPQPKHRPYRRRFIYS